MMLLIYINVKKNYEFIEIINKMEYNKNNSEKNQENFIKKREHKVLK